jgi:hypothetical protein
MAGVPVPDEHDDMAGETIEHKTVARPVVRVELEAPDGVELRVTINGVGVDLDD